MLKDHSHMIKRFLVARTPKELELAQLKNNMIKGKMHQYDIIFDGKKWYAWYLEQATDLIKPLNLTGGDK